MDVRTRNYFVLAIVFLIGITAAAALLMGRSALPEPDPFDGTEQVVGIVVQVESEGLTDVRGFTLRTGADADMLFVMDRLENGTDFPPAHLVEHQASSSPIRVWYRTEGGIHYAIGLEDAEQTG